MSVLTISASNSLMDSVKTIFDAEFATAKWHKEGNYTFLELPRTVEVRSNLKIMNVLAAIIFGQLAHLWIQRLLQLNYNYFDPEEKQIILRNAYKQLSGCSRDLYHRVYSVLTDYLMTNDQINLEGFVRFRIKDFWQFLTEAVDAAVDAYLIEREYQEFVRLLRYFVELQEPKIEMVNVIIDQPDSFHILDYKGEEIQTEHLEDMILELGHNELDFEDFLISALITIAPAKLVLHLCQGNRVEQTILNIFTHRVMVCDGCALCKDMCNCHKGK